MIFLLNIQQLKLQLPAPSPEPELINNTWLRICFILLLLFIYLYYILLYYTEIASTKTEIPNTLIIPHKHYIIISLDCTPFYFAILLLNI